MLMGEGERSRRKEKRNTEVLVKPERKGERSRRKLVKSMSEARAKLKTE